MSKFDMIFEDLKRKIDEEEIIDFLPSESVLQQKYNVSRGTIRRAVKKLENHGYCTTRQGQPTVINFQKELPFKISGYKSFESAIKEGYKWTTSLVYIREVIIDEGLYVESHFPIGANAIEIVRTRNIDGVAVIIDHHYFLKKIVQNISSETAETSIYRYLEKELGLKPSITRWNWSCEPKDNFTKAFLQDKYNLVMINKKHAFLEDGTLFEYTVSSYNPEYFDMKIINERNK